MKRKLNEPVHAKVLALWRARLAALNEKLAANPSADDAWFWRIQFEILNYLLHRYAGDQVQSLIAWPIPADSMQLSTLPAPASLAVTPISAFSPGALSGKPPRASSEIRRRLQNIIENNHDRYQILQNLRDELVRARRMEYQGARPMMDKYHALLEHYAKQGESGKLPRMLTADELDKKLATIIFIDSTADPPDHIREGGE